MGHSDNEIVLRLVLGCLPESRLHFKHSLAWRPRPPRDLLLSVALENYSAAKLSSESLAQLTPQVKFPPSLFFPSIFVLVFLSQTQSLLGVSLDFRLNKK